MKKASVLLSAIFYILIIISIIFMTAGVIRYASGKKLEKQTASIVAKYTKEEVVITEAENPHAFPKKVVDLSGLQKENPDTKGFLYIPETIISYPVMESETDGYYLKYDFSGEKSIYGCIYIDPACYDGGQIVLLHGHNMRDGSMFGGLKKYLDADYLRAHDEIQYTDGNGLKTYRICAVFTGDVSDTDLMTCLIPYTKDEAKRLTEQMKNGLVTEDITEDDEWIILSTCHGKKKSGRLYVVGKKII